MCIEHAGAKAKAPPCQFHLAGEMSFSLCSFGRSKLYIKLLHLFLSMQVEALIKKQLLNDPEGQVVEDALCLCFLQYQLPGRSIRACLAYN